MSATSHKKYFAVSVIFHLTVVLVLILGFDFSSPLVVIENTNKTDVISAVILGDTQKSKVITQPISQPEPVQSVTKPVPKLVVKQPPEIKKETIALKPQKKLKPDDIFGKNLLQDLEKVKKQAEHQKKLKEKKLKEQFEKTLRQQAEKSMRQQLLNEDIKLKGTESREAQGIVNKYQALIQQAISEHWIIPSQSNKKSYSTLLIRLGPGGVVLDVQVTRSSGDTALDNSARAAVFKASPLPVPNDPSAFEAFRQFNLKARPEVVAGI